MGGHSAMMLADAGGPVRAVTPAKPAKAPAPAAKATTPAEKPASAKATASKAKSVTSPKAAGPHTTPAQVDHIAQVRAASAAKGKKTKAPRRPVASLPAPKEAVTAKGASGRSAKSAPRSNPLEAAAGFLGGVAASVKKGKFAKELEAKAPAWAKWAVTGKGGPVDVARTAERVLRGKQSPIAAAGDLVWNAPQTQLATGVVKGAADLVAGVSTLGYNLTIGAALDSFDTARLALTDKKAFNGKLERKQKETSAAFDSISNSVLLRPQREMAQLAWNSAFDHDARDRQIKGLKTEGIARLKETDGDVGATIGNLFRRDTELGGVVDPYVTAVEEGRGAEALGRGVFDVGSMFVGVGEVNAAVKGSKLATGRGKTGEVTKGPEGVGGAEAAADGQRAVSGSTRRADVEQAAAEYSYHSPALGKLTPQQGARAKALVAQALDDLPPPVIQVNRSADGLAALLRDDAPMRTIFDMDAAPDLAMRKQREELLNIHGRGPDAGRTAYGSVQYNGSAGGVGEVGAVNAGIPRYGDFSMVLKDSAWDRTTVLPDDSVLMARNQYVPGAAENLPDVVTELVAKEYSPWFRKELPDEEIIGKLKTELRSGLTSEYAFIEAQIRGGFTRSDIAEIRIQPGTPQGDVARIRELAEPLGIPVRQG